MKSKDKIITDKILNYCDQIDEACQMFNSDFEKFKTVSVFSNACCMCVLQIGELCKLISDEYKSETPEVPWKSWCGIRDVFAHQYSNLDYQTAWDTIQNDLPVIKNAIKRHD